MIKNTEISRALFLNKISSQRSLKLEKGLLLMLMVLTLDLGTLVDVVQMRTLGKLMRTKSNLLRMSHHYTQLCSVTFNNSVTDFPK